MKRSISAILAVLMAFTAFAFTGSAAGVTADTSWYDASQSEFVITTAAQLMGVASVGADFAGKTIRLGADITVNAGDAASWLNSAPETSWTPISGFAGTFDGDGHTVSGLYVSGSSNSAMFRNVASGAVIEDFRLVNSCFVSAGASCAAVASSGGGTYRDIYSDATVSCGDHHAGGILGVAGSDVTVESCWFDGSVTLTMRYGAGIVGNGNGHTVVIRHCLNTGSVRSRYTASAASHIGGICGRNDASTTIYDCLNTGRVSSAYGDANGSDVSGAIFGCCGQNLKTEDGSAWISHLSVTRSWGAYESNALFVGINYSKDPDNAVEEKMISEAQLKGYDAYYNTDLDFDDHWAVNMNGVPVPKVFSETDPVLYDVNAPAISETEIKATGRYGPRWTVTLTLPAGFSKSSVKLGLLAVPTKALPNPGYDITLADTSFSWRGKDYPVLSAGAYTLRESDYKTVIATFVISNLNENTIRSNITVRPYATYTVPEGKLTVYGSSVSTSFYTEAKTVADPALRAKVDKALSQVDQAMGEGFTVSRDWSVLDLFENVPALLADGSVIKPQEDFGAGSHVIEVDGISGAYSGYLALLERFGFEKVVDNGVNGLFGKVFTATYKNGDLYITVTAAEKMNKMYVSAAYDLNISEHLFDRFRYTAAPGEVTSLHQLELYYVGNCFVIRLKNGHFIVSDGGTDKEQDYLLTYLESMVPAGQKPVIEAWIVTHLHNDHFYVLNNFNTHPEWANRVYIEGFYFSEPSDAVKDQDPGVYSEIAGEFRGINRTRTSSGEVPKIYRPHTGERYYFCDVTMDIMLTQEQIPVASYVNSFNDSSTFYLFTMDSQTFLNGGDGHQPTMRFLMDAYDPEELAVDFFQLLHHGHNTWDQFTDYVGDFTTILCPADISAWTRIHSKNPANVHLLDVSDEYFVAGYGTDIFYLPYTPGREGTDGGHVKLAKQHFYITG